MFRQLLFAIGLTGLTVTIHAVGTAWLLRLTLANWRTSPTNRRPYGGVMRLMRLVCGLLLLNLAEMTVWALVFAAMRIFEDVETSLYYSLTSFTTVGYGDVLPPRAWRLLGPIEAAVGVLMLGWSTGILVAAVQRIYQPGNEARGSAEA